VKKLYRAKDLIAMGVVGSLPTLSRMIEAGVFPPGKLASPNRRVWSEDEVDEYYASCPTAKKISMTA
jgi:predicted DNA-binding transcriptional regulator AlpA